MSTSLRKPKFTQGPWKLHPEDYPDAGGYEAPCVFHTLTTTLR
jgi:hypothetical protein